MQTGEKGLVKITTAADELAVSRRYVYNLRDRGLLEFVYLGPRMPRVRTADIEAIIREGTRGPSRRVA